MHFPAVTALTEVLLENGSTLTSENFGEVADKVVIRWNEGNLTWTLDAEGTMAISGTGAMKNYGTNNSPAAQKKASVKKVVIERWHHKHRRLCVFRLQQFNKH